MLSSAPYKTHDAQNLDILSRQLEDDYSVMEKWLSDNILKLNNEKCLMIFVDKGLRRATTQVSYKNKSL